MAPAAGEADRGGAGRIRAWATGTTAVEGVVVCTTHLQGSPNG